MRHNRPVIVDGDRLRELLRSLDDPEHLEFPADYDHASARSRFDQLVDQLEAAFSCGCPADRHVEDASYHGRVEIPAEAAATGSRLVIVVSNFGNLAVMAVDNSGAWTQEESSELLHPDDADRIQAALDSLGYTMRYRDENDTPFHGKYSFRADSGAAVTGGTPGNRTQREPGADPAAEPRMTEPKVPWRGNGNLALVPRYAPRTFATGMSHPCHQGRTASKPNCSLIEIMY
jgi:hypothetical protein